MTRAIGALLAGLALTLPQGAAAQTITTGQSLKDRCATVQLTSPMAGLGCRGYIGAVADILDDGHAVYGYRACTPPGTAREEQVRAVKSWLERHPDDLPLKASRLVAKALSDRYPCSAE